MKLICGFLIFVLFGFSFTGNCQSIIDWQKCFGGSNSEPNYGDISNKLIKTIDNSYVILTGTKSNDGDVSNYSGDDFGDIWVVKMDASGNKLWDRCLGGNSYDFPYSITETNDGSLLVMGTTDSNNIPGYHTNGDLLISKLNQNGIILWQKCFGGSGYDSDAKNNNGIYGNNFSPQHWIEKPNGNIVIVCETRSNDGDIVGFHNSSGSPQDIWMFEIGSTGNIIRQKCIGGSSFDIPIELKINNNSDYLLLGYTLSNDGDIPNSYGQGDFVLFKIDPLFNIVWTKVIGTVNEDVPACLVVENDGDIIVSGISDTPSVGYDGQIVIHKLDNNGTVIYSKNYGGSSNEGGIGISINPPILHPTENDGYVFGTISNSNDGDVNLHYGDLYYWDYWIVKIDYLGDIIWSKVLGTDYDDYEYIYLDTKTNGELIVTLGNGVAFTSGNLANQNHHGEIDIGILKFDSNGILLSYNCIGGSDMDVPLDIFHDFTNNSNIVLGYTNSNNGDVSGNHGGAGDIWVVKLTPESLSSPSFPQNFISISPNPAITEINISFNNISYLTGEKINIVNFLGQQVANYPLTLTGTSTRISLNSWRGTGIYFVQIINAQGQIVDIKKIILQ